MADTVSDTAKKVADHAIEKTGDTAEKISGIGGEMIDRAQDKAKEVAHDAIEKTADKLEHFADRLDDEEITIVEDEA